MGTFRFENLIQEIDRCCYNGLFGENKVVCQIGSGEYTPSHCNYFRYADDLSGYYDDASAIISHGGTGSILTGLRAHKPLLIFANTKLQNNHQVEFLHQLSKQIDIEWSDNVAELEMRFRLLSASPSNPLNSQQLTNDIQYFLQQ